VKGAIINWPSSDSASEFPQDVEFDIAVTETETAEAKAGIAVLFATIAGRAQTQFGSTGSEVNRIRFSIPVILPPQR
jgi:hypothetical protein